MIDLLLICKPKLYVYYRDYFDRGLEENCYKSMRILSVLYNAVIAAIYPDMIGIPFVRIVTV